MLKEVIYKKLLVLTAISGGSWLYGSRHDGIDSYFSLLAFVLSSVGVVVNLFQLGDAAAKISAAISIILHPPVHLNEYKNMKVLHAAIKKYMETYNSQRLHSAIDYQTPDEVYYQAMNNLGEKGERLLPKVS